MSSVPAIASGWLATIPTGWPPIVAKRGDEVRRPAGRSSTRSPSSTIAAITDAHVVAAGRRGGEQVAGLGRGAVGGIVRRPARRVPRRRARGGRRAAARPSRRGRVARRRRRATRRRCARACTAAPPSSSASIAHAGELGDHRRAAHERVGVGGHHHVVGQAEQRARARTPPARSRAITTGTMPEQSASARAASPQPWRAAMPSTMSAPLDAMEPTSGMRSASAMCAAIGDGLAVVGAQRSLAIGGIDLDDDRRTAADVVDPRGDTASGSGPDRDAHRPEVTTVSGQPGAGRARCRPGWSVACGSHDPSHDVGDALRLGRQHAATPIGEADAAASEAPHRQPLPVAREVRRHRGRGQHGRPEALERERGGETHAVDLGLGLQPARRPGPPAPRARRAAPCPARSAGGGSRRARASVTRSRSASGWSAGATSNRSSSKSGSVASSASSTGRFTTARSRWPDEELERRARWCSPRPRRCGPGDGCSRRPSRSGARAIGRWCR